MTFLLHFLAQIEKPPLDSRPQLNLQNSTGGTSGMTWVIAAVLVAGVLLITFKTSKRNHMDRE